MIRFEDDFEVALELSEHELSAYLLSVIDTDLDEMASSLANTKKLFRGHVKFNQFKLIPIQTSFRKTYGLIKGEFKYGDGKLLVKGKAVKNKFFFAFSIVYIVLGFVVLINYLFSTPEDEIKLAAMMFLFLIGIGNAISIKRSIKRLKTNFIDRLKFVEKEKYRKANNI